MFAVSALATIIFLGGWNSPVGGLSSPLWFVVKSTFLVWVQMWIRWTLPRIRIDQVMHACVKYLLPFTMLLFVGSSLWQLYDNPAHPVFEGFATVLRFGLGCLGLLLLGLYVLRSGLRLLQSQSACRDDGPQAFTGSVTGNARNG